jgi:uncharacterized OsmC-like protein
MTSSVFYEGHLRTTCTHLQSGNYFETDAPVDNNGKGERFSPTDLLATSLATCMLTVMGIKARNTMNMDIAGIKADVLKIMKAVPRRVAGITLTFQIPEQLKEMDKKLTGILMDAALNCPVMKSIHPDIEVKVDWGGWG